MKSLGTDARFAFGQNWTRFLEVLDDGRVMAAEHSLVDMLQLRDLRGMSFLDAGSGSGLFSLAAKRLGATRVHSFDYDPASVACTLELKRRYFPNDCDWKIAQGSVLDAEYLRSLGSFDVVYSWGVLHHTGDMWRGLENVACAVKPGGWLFVAIYNDQGDTSRRWAMIKRLYNNSPALIRLLLIGLVAAQMGARVAIERMMRLKSPLPGAILREHKPARGMSVWHDLVDWVGGYPFEVAKPEEVIHSLVSRGFTLERLVTCGGKHGNNQFVLRRARAVSEGRGSA